VALVPRDDVVRCIEQRALGLQGWRDELWIERLRTQRYGAKQHYAHHFDWGSGSRGWGRVSSIMAWVLADELEGGGTEFPQLRRNEGGRWCEWVECQGDGNRTGVTFRPIAGNAVYWENFKPDGTGLGFDETWHAGLPVKKGVKIGLNIWSWGRLDGIV
jgi:prolyl 4-hydroxylase